MERWRGGDAFASREPDAGAIYPFAHGGAAMFDSPFEFCAVCRAYVLLDQTQRQCAHEHGCAPTAACPLQQYFTGIEFDRGKGTARCDEHGKRPRANDS